MRGYIIKYDNYSLKNIKTLFLFDKTARFCRMKVWLHTLEILEEGHIKLLDVVFYFSHTKSDVW